MYKLKRILILIFIFAFCSFFCSCTLISRIQNGPELSETIAPLYSEAVHSLLWCHGWSNGLDKKTNPNIKIIDTDEYGRVLFVYSEGYAVTSFDFANLQWKSDKLLSFFTYAILVAQKTDETYVYFYPDINYMCVNIDAETHMPLDVSTEELEELKCKNDWNKNISISDCVRTEYDIYRGSMLDKSDNLYKSYNIDSLENIFENQYDCLMRTNYLQKDSNGLVLGSMESYVYSNSDDIDPEILIIFVVDEDGVYKYLDNTIYDFDKIKYCDAVIQLKSIADWSELYEN